MVREAILKAITHTTLILFMALVALLPLHMVLKMQLWEQNNSLKNTATTRAAVFM
tara:strand:+ start:607 stop:771 length:165 start_codon:yes stop_codon:yes gene_type:complete